MPEGNPLGYLDPMIAQQPPQQVPMAPLDDETKSRLQAYVSQPAQTQPEGAFFSKIPVDPDEARKAEQRAAFQKEKDAVQQKIFEADQRELDEQIADAEKKKQVALKAGFTPEEVSAKFDPQIANLTDQKAQMSLAVAPAPEQPAQMSLAIDGKTLGNQVDPQFQIPGPTAPAAGGGGFGLIEQGYKDAAKAGEQAAIATETAIRTGDALAEQREMVYGMQKQKQAFELQKEEKRYKDAVDELSNTKVDPGRFWSNKSTGDKIITGLGLFLGALGAAKDGVNRAAGIVENQIKQDLDAQQVDINTKKAGVAGMGNVLDQMRDRFKDEDIAYAAATSAGLQRVQNQLLAIDQNLKGGQQKANLKVLLGELKLKQDAANATVQNGMLQKILLSQDPMNQILSALPDIDKKNGVDEYNAWKSAQEGVGNVDKAYKEIIKKVGNPALNMPMGAEEKEVEAFNARIFAMVKQAMGERFTDQDAKELVGPFKISRKDFTQGHIDAKLNQIKKLMTDKVHTPTLNRYRLTPQTNAQKMQEAPDSLAGN